MGDECCYRFGLALFRFQHGGIVLVGLSEQVCDGSSLGMSTRVCANRSASDLGYIKIGIVSIDNLNSASLPRFARPFFPRSMFC